MEITFVHFIYTYILHHNFNIFIIVGLFDLFKEINSLSPIRIKVGNPTLRVNQYKDATRRVDLSTTKIRSK